MKAMASSDSQLLDRNIKMGSRRGEVDGGVWPHDLTGHGTGDDDVENLNRSHYMEGETADSHRESGGGGTVKRKRAGKKGRLWAVIREGRQAIIRVERKRVHSKVWGADQSGS